MYNFEEILTLKQQSQSTSWEWKTIPGLEDGGTLSNSNETLLKKENEEDFEATKVTESKLGPSRHSEEDSAVERPGEVSGSTELLDSRADNSSEEAEG